MRKFIRNVANQAVDSYRQAQAELEAKQRTQQAAYMSAQASHTQQPTSPPSYQQWQQPAAMPQPSPVPNREIPEAKHESVVHEHEIPLDNQTSSPSECSPLNAIQGGPFYICALMPDLDVCPACYASQIVNTPFASSFRLITYPANTEHNCDLSAAAVLTAWQTAVARAGPTPPESEKTIWLQQFATQVDAVKQRIQVLVTTIQTQSEEIQIQRLQQQTQQHLAVNQIRLGFHDQIWTGGGNLNQQMGNNRFIDASQMSLGIARKEVGVKQARAELERILGRAIP